MSDYRPTNLKCPSCKTPLVAEKRGENYYFVKCSNGNHVYGKEMKIKYVPVFVNV